MGEVRQAESLDLLIALNSGLPGITYTRYGDVYTLAVRSAASPRAGGPLTAPRGAAIAEEAAG